MYECIISRYLDMMRKLLAGPKFNFAEVSSMNVPKEPGVYVIYDKKKAKAIVYAGRTGNLRRRLLGGHRRGSIKSSQFRRALKQNSALRSESEITSYILENCSFQFRVIKEFEQMVRLEHFIIATMAPVLNTKLKQ